MFCIRHIKDGLYSTGGTNPSFVEIDDGREWAQKGHLKRHLRLANYEKGTCEIVEFDDTSRSEVAAYPLDGYYQPVAANMHYGDSSSAHNSVPVCGTTAWGEVTRVKKKVTCDNCRKTKAFKEKK